ncbi:MAG: restriction endonuclease [Gemmatimonadales bacterium]
MAELPKITPDSFEILVVRELRKAGLEVAQVRVHRRTELPKPEGGGFLLELRAWLSRAGWGKRALIACRRQEGVIGGDAIDTLAQRLAEAQADVGLLFATADFTPDALAGGEERGIALLRLVDARTTYDTGGWGTPGHYPSWLPAYLVQVIDRDTAGQTRARLLEAGRADLVVERLRPKGGQP